MSSSKYKLYVEESFYQGALIGAVMYGDTMPVSPIALRVGPSSWDWSRFHYFEIDDGTPDLNTLPMWRPLQDAECSAVVGAKLETKAGTVRLVSHYDPRREEFTLTGGRETNRWFFSPKELLELFTCEGSPCGVKNA